MKFFGHSRPVRDKQTGQITGSKSSPVRARTVEPLDYVDVVVDGLLEMGIISPDRHGRMTENQREELAEKLVERSEE